MRLGPDGEYVASYAIDDKGSVAGLLELAARLTEPPRHPVELVFTAREEIGCHGAKWYASRTDAEAAGRVRGDAGREGVPHRRRGPTRCWWPPTRYGPLDDRLGAELEDAAAAAGLTHAPRGALQLRLGRDSRRCSRRDDRPHRLPRLRHREHPRLRDRAPGRDRGLRGRAGALAGRLTEPGGLV